MNLSEQLNEKTIISHLKSECKQGAMQELLDHFYKLNYLTATIKLFSSLDSQEKQLPSASGRGIAYHYSTSIEVDKMVAVLGISKTGIDYHASDGLMCHFILLILEFSVKTYILPSIITGDEVTRSPIFLKLSTFPVTAELTIKYPFNVTEYNFSEPIINPDILVFFFLFFNNFKMLVDEIIFSEILFIITK